MKKLIIFTDLDGTLLDFNTYSFEPALPSLRLIKEREIPLVICSSKTRKEIEYYRKKLDNHHPFISENGGGIFIPKDYFGFDIQPCNPPTPPFSKGGRGGFSEENNYHIIRLGAKYSDLRKAIQALHLEGFDIKGFGDITVEEVARLANMSIDEAEMAKERDFDEPFILHGSKADKQRLLEAISTKGFNYTEGRFFHILGESDKGEAISILIDLYKKKLREITTVAIGDSPNDIPMLKKVDYPIIVKKHNKSYDTRINIPNLIKADGIGPRGWNRTVLKLLSDIT